MFHLNDYAISEAELGIWKTTATISEDGFIYFDNQKKYGERHLFNACDILLYWETGDIFGIQRIRLGNLIPLGRKGWRHALNSGRREKAIEQRKKEVSDVFLGQKVNFDLIGWHPLNVTFWKPGIARRLSPPSERRVIADETRNIHAAMAKAGIKTDENA